MFVKRGGGFRCSGKIPTGSPPQGDGGFCQKWVRAMPYVGSSAYMLVRKSEP